MSLKTKLLILTLFVAIGTHAYLSMHYYPLKLGLNAEPSICNVNASFNCDTVAASKYSSFLNIPMALWGLVTNLVFLLLVLVDRLSLADNRKALGGLISFFALTATLASVVMAVISVSFLTSYCLFCILTYFLSFIALYLVKTDQEESIFTSIKQLLPELMSQKSFIVYFLLVPFFGFIGNSSALSYFGAGKMDVAVANSINGWKSNPQQQFNTPPSLTKGDPNAKVVITEFADFLCGHCKTAYKGLRSFAQSHPEVRFDFRTFPLDSTCNAAMKRGSGSQCFLAKAVYCAEEQKVGWQLHDYIFENQTEFAKAGIPSNMKSMFVSFCKDNNCNWDTVNTCIEKNETHEFIAAQAAEGEKAKLRGTPTVFLNGKIAPRGQSLWILEAIYKEL